MVPISLPAFVRDGLQLARRVRNGELRLERIFLFHILRANFFAVQQKLHLVAARVDADVQRVPSNPGHVQLRSSSLQPHS